MKKYYGIKEAKRRKQLKKELIEDIKLTIMLFMVVGGFFALMFTHWIIFGY